MYDDICKFIAENFSRDLAAWLLGESIELTVLEQVVKRIEEIQDPKEQGKIVATTAILAGLVLDKITIRRLLREEIMKESVIYQDIQAEEAANLVHRQLRRRFGEIPQNLSEQIRELPVEQIENLAEALLDFESLADLISWLN